MINKLIIALLINSFFFYIYQISIDFIDTYKERNYYDKVINNLSYKKEEKKDTLKIIDSGWLSYTIKFKKEIIDENDKMIKVNNSKHFIIPKNISFSGSILAVDKYVEDSPIVIPKNNLTIYEDLKQGVRLAPNAKLPNQKWITFIEWHSGQNFRWTLTYSYFDSLSRYYDKVDYKTKAYIKTKNYTFEYELFKKEIIHPGEKDFYNSNFHHLILMTCYPRNTSDKRALFHFKLINITKHE